MAERFIEKVIERMVADMCGLIDLAFTIGFGIALFKFFEIDATSDNIQIALLLYLIFAHSLSTSLLTKDDQS